ncbi:hypothetical protein [Roseivirga sp.]|uniref:hypothetical protein n=1 Tax=Roseivirga sp. TaxID=1964215 RepID=UPI002B26ED34|nr:hypothetical protein [Roseivirga sp.]
MKDKLTNYISGFEDFYALNKTSQIDAFAYFIEEVEKTEFFSPTLLKSCFELSKIKPYTNISGYLTSNLKAPRGKKPKFLKSKSGYSLNSAFKVELAKTITLNKPKAITSKTLRDLLVTISDSEENVFLDEAIKCFEIGAFRASIIMVWNLTVDSLFEYILSNKLTEFNSVLSTNTDRRVRISSMSVKDDFSEIPEGKFIEFCRQSRIISNDVRKILDEKLGIRNTYAHPSNMILTESKAIEFIEDLINNVVLKYKK